MVLAFALIWGRKRVPPLIIASQCVPVAQQPGYFSNATGISVWGHGSIPRAGSQRAEPVGNDYWSGGCGHFFKPKGAEKMTTPLPASQGDRPEGFFF